MTVIAYAKGVLAADTQGTTDGGMIVRTKKIEHLKNGTVVGTAGDADCREVLALLGKASINKMPSKASLIKTETVFEGIWLFPEPLALFVVSIENEEGKWAAEIRPLMDGWSACGSGAKYAAGAMAAGKSAVEAVKIACKLDANCSLPVETYKVGTTGQKKSKSIAEQ